MFVAPGFNPGENEKGKDRPRENVEKRDCLVSDETEQMIKRIITNIE